jgi:hypothetical protein
MSSKSSKRRDGNRQREQKFNSRESAEERAWERWSNPANQPGTTASAMPDADLLIKATADVDFAVRASMVANEDVLLQAIETLTSPRLHNGRRAGAVAVQRTLADSLNTLFDSGWQPADLAHVVQKLSSSEHREVLVLAMTWERFSTLRVHIDDRWANQLTSLGVVMRPGGVEPDVFHQPGGHSLVAEMRLIGEVRVGVELLVTLRRLPALPKLMPPPSEKPHAARAVGADVSPLDEKVLSKVRGLLSKAESTTFDEEADALTAKAQELMARHAIDLAMLDASAPVAAGALARRVHIEDPYYEAKAVLLTVVADANHCKAVTATSLGMVTLFGFSSDLDIVELLFTSLLTQATSAMVAAGRDVDSSGTTRTKSFRRAFILSFATRVSERLEEAAQAAAADARATMGDSFLPVLANRDDEVLAHQREMFPNLKFTKSTITNAAGWHAGRQAADRANLNAAVPIANRR